MSESSTLPTTIVRPGDRRYPALSRGFNQRWVAAPEYVRLVRTPEEVRKALADAVREEPADPARARITVRAGGHCYEDFGCGDDVRVILDVSPMCGVSYDGSMKAYCVEAGATNGHVYSQLYPVSGKVLPGGSCFSVGVGGHVPAGGFGLLSRQHGLTVDYLYAVEVAVVGGAGNVSLVVAGRDDPDGPQAMTDFIAAVDGRIGPPATRMRSVMGEHFADLDVPRVLPWLTAAQALNSRGENRCGKHKSAYLRKPFTDQQIGAMWAFLGMEKCTGYVNGQALIQVDSYGGAINRRLRETAARQRDSIMKVQYQVYWTKQDAREDAHIAWIRDAYRATFAATGGVPVAGGDTTDGCYVGYPDADLGDQRWNGSGQSWEALYYKDAYAKLQQVKRHRGPCGVFRHAQSIRPAAGE